MSSPSKSSPSPPTDGDDSDAIQSMLSYVVNNNNNSIKSHDYFVSNNKSKIISPLASKTTTSKRQSSKIEKIKITSKINTNNKHNVIIDGSGLSCSVYFLVQFFAIIILSLIACWLIEFSDGFKLISYNNNNDIIGYFDNKMINFHPIIMTFSMIYILANSILFINSSKQLSSKRLFLLMTTLSIGIVGTVIVVVWHFKMKIGHFHSLHSWLGMLTWIMIIFYLIYIIYVYDHQDLSENERLEMVLSVRMFGIAILILAGTTCLLGFNQIISMKKFVKLSIKFNNDTSKNSEDNQMKVSTIIANIIGILLFFYIAIMIDLIIRLRYKPRENLRRQQMERQIREIIERARLTIDNDDDDNNDESMNTSFNK